MYEFLIGYYPWVEAFHIISVISWMAGMLYLPRLFVYHSQQVVGSDQDKLFQLMEHRLLRLIMNPAMILTWVFGLLLLYITKLYLYGDFWLYVKIGSVLSLTIFHMKLAAWRRAFAEGKCEKSEGFFRKANEIPTILMITIVIMVVVKPF